MTLERSHVLIAEDSEFMAQRVLEALQSPTYDITHVRSAEDALEMLETEAVDCALVNYELSDQTGIELIESAPSDIPIILLTSAEIDTIAAEALDAGVTEFVRKDNLAAGSMPVLANRVDVVIRAAR